MIVNGAIDSGSGSMPSASWIIVMLPATTISYTSAGSTPASSQTSSVSCCERLVRARLQAVERVVVHHRSPRSAR